MLYSNSTSHNGKYLFAVSVITLGSVFVLLDVLFCTSNLETQNQHMNAPDFI